MMVVVAVVIGEAAVEAVAAALEEEAAADMLTAAGAVKVENTHEPPYLQSSTKIVENNLVRNAPQKSISAEAPTQQTANKSAV